MRDDDRASTSSSVTKSVKSLNQIIADGTSGSKNGSQKSSAGSTSSMPACSQAARAGNKDRSHSSSPGSTSSMPECSQAAAAAATNGVCIVSILIINIKFYISLSNLCSLPVRYQIHSQYLLSESIHKQGYCLSTILQMIGSTLLQ